MITNYEPLAIKTTVKGICSICKKKKQRVCKVEMTANPFNRNADGTVKSAQQVWEDVKTEHSARAEKLKADFHCSSCDPYYV